MYSQLNGQIYGYMVQMRFNLKHIHTYFFGWSGQYWVNKLLLSYWRHDIKCINCHNLLLSTFVIGHCSSAVTLLLAMKYSSSHVCSFPSPNGFLYNLSSNSCCDSHSSGWTGIRRASWWYHLKNKVDTICLPMVSLSKLRGYEWIFLNAHNTRGRIETQNEHFTVLCPIGHGDSLFWW